MGRGWCVGRPGSVTGQRVSRQAEERQGACGPTCIGDRQLLHRNEPTFVGPAQKFLLTDSLFPDLYCC